MKLSLWKKETLHAVAFLRFMITLCLEIECKFRLVFKFKFKFRFRFGLKLYLQAQAQLSDFGNKSYGPPAVPIVWSPYCNPSRNPKPKPYPTPPAYRMNWTSFKKPWKSGMSLTRWYLGLGLGLGLEVGLGLRIEALERAGCRSPGNTTWNYIRDFTMFHIRFCIEANS